MVVGNTEVAAIDRSLLLFVDLYDIASSARSQVTAGLFAGAPVESCTSITSSPAQAAQVGKLDRFLQLLLVCSRSHSKVIVK